MWWSKNKEPAAKPESFINKNRKGKTTRNRSRPTEASLLNTAETHSGFEVHFVPNNERNDDKSSSGETLASVADRLLSIDHLMTGRRKVHRSQYSSHGWNNTSVSSFTHPTVASLVPRSHRVMLSGTKKHHGVESSSSTVQEIRSLLQRHDVSSELHCLQEEMKLLDVEIAALKKDRADMDNDWKHLTMPKVVNSDKKHADPHSLLLLGGALTLEEKSQLQEQRGVCLTLRLSNENCRAFLLSKCGYKTSFFSQFVPTTTTKSSAPITLTKENCGEGGPAASIQHMSLLSDDSVFFSLDSAQSHHHGRLPERLYRRLPPDPNNMNQLLYVSTGPLGCYYAEFRSGNVVWGMASDSSSDGDEFATLCREWNVSRVAFGPFCTVHDRHGIVHRAASWIILSKDGRAAWKNVPRRLHRLLEDRLASQAAPVEVSLGYGDSYFVRFLDGTVDYCLPAHIASVLDDGKLDVVSMALHPELPYDFVMRHR